MTDTVLLIGGRLDGKRVEIRNRTPYLERAVALSWTEFAREAYECLPVHIDGETFVVYRHADLTVTQTLQRLITRYPDYEAPK